MYVFVSLKTYLQVIMNHNNNVYVMYIIIMDSNNNNEINEDSAELLKKTFKLKIV